MFSRTILPALLVGLLSAAALPTGALAVGVGDPAPDFLLEDILTGEPIFPSDHLGKIVVLIFYAPW